MQKAKVKRKSCNSLWSAAEHNNANQDRVAGDAHFGAAMSYDYWKLVHGRNSFDGAGAQVCGYVHYDDTPGDGHGYDNAGWTGAEMVCGDGGTRYRPLTSLDVCAHELGHAVCQYTTAPTAARLTGLAPAATLTAGAYPNPAQDVLRLTLTDGQQTQQPHNQRRGLR